MESTNIRSVTVRFRGSKAAFGQARYCQANLSSEFMNDLTPVNQIVIGRMIVTEKPKEPPVSSRTLRSRGDNATAVVATPQQPPAVSSPAAETTPTLVSPLKQKRDVEQIAPDAVEVEEMLRPPALKKTRFDTSRTIGIAITAEPSTPQLRSPSINISPLMNLNIPDDCSSAPSTTADTVFSSTETGSELEEPMTANFPLSELTIKPSIDYCSMYWKQYYTFGKRKCLDSLDTATMQLQCSFDFWLWFEVHNFFQQINPQTFDFSILELLDSAKHSEATNKRTWFTPLEDLPDDDMNNIDYMMTKQYLQSQPSNGDTNSSLHENPLVAPGNTQDKVEEYYDVYKEEFNSLLNLIQQKLQQQQNKQSSGSTPRRNFSTDIVSERLSIMEQLLSQHKLQINKILSNIRRNSVEQSTFWAEYDQIQQSTEHEKMVLKRWNQSKAKKIKKHGGPLR